MALILYSYEVESSKMVRSIQQTLPLYRALFATPPATAKPMPIFVRVLNSRDAIVTNSETKYRHILPSVDRSNIMSAL